jgi:hypothetical protein
MEVALSRAFNGYKSPEMEARIILLKSSKLGRKVV